MRLKFGPRIAASLILPVVASAATVEDPAVDADLGAVEMGTVPGTVRATVLFRVEAYDPKEKARLTAVYAIGIPAGQAEPADEQAALDSPHVKGSADATGHTAGGELPVILDGLPEGAVTILTVLAFDDPDPSAA